MEYFTAFEKTIRKLLKLGNIQATKYTLLLAYALFWSAAVSLFIGDLRIKVI